MSNIFAKPTNIPYFDNLKSPAFRSVATVVERVQKHMGTRYIQSSFNKDMLALGYARPSQKDMDRFLAGCEAGLIELATREASEEKPEDAKEGTSDQVVEEVLDDAPSPVLPVVPAASEQPDTKSALTPLDLMRNPFAILIESMMADTMAELQRDLETQARILVAARLRQMVDSYESGEFSA